MTGGVRPAQTALLSVAQMAEADRAAIAAGTPGSVLMQNAGNAVAQEIIRRWPPCPVTVLCGPGNNGGDGFVAALALAQAGWPVRVALLGDRERLRGDARFHAMRWNGSIDRVSPAALEGAALVVDALFGSGLSRPLDPQVAATLGAVAQRGLPLIAVDVPSGVMGDTGESVGAAPRGLHRHLRAQKARPRTDARPGLVRGNRGRGYRHSRLRSRIACASTAGRTIPGYGGRNGRAANPRRINTRGDMPCCAAAIP